MARVQAAMLCNAASIEQSGLVSMLGAFVDTMTGPVLPVTGQAWIVARILWDDDDLDRPQAIGIRVTSPSGEVAAELGGMGLVAADDGTDLGGLPPASLMALPLVVQFEEVGVFEISLSIDDNTIWRAPLRIVVELPPLE